MQTETSGLTIKVRNHKLTDDLEIHFIELPKWHKGDVEKMNRLEDSESDGSGEGIPGRPGLHHGV
ncbi:MAG: hypothetical protein IJ601_12425 [Acidaminococcaceae bacterium]|nr:hypothetical protein [Acidaminococcaceae bacterium]